MAYTYYKIAAFSGGWHDGAIGIEVDSQSVSGNYSIVNIVLRVRETTNASSNNSGGANVYLSIDGVQKVTSDSIDFSDFATGTWYTILSKTGIKVYHNSDGTKTINLKGYCATGVGAGTYNQNQDITLPKIARKSSISSITSPVSINGTNAVTVNISRADASYTHKVTFSLGSASQQYTGVGTSQSYAIPLAWMNQIITDTTAIANCRVETFSGSTSLGYVDETFAVTVPSTVVPVVSDIFFSKVADAFSSGIYVKGTSKLNVTGAGITTQYSAGIVRYEWFWSFGSGLYGTASNVAFFTSDLIPFWGTVGIAVRVTDQRGRVSALYTKTFTAYPYSPPSVTVTGSRCNASGSPDPNGEYLKARIQATINNVNDDNSKTYTLQYKRSIDSTWTSIDVSALNTYQVDASYVRAASSSYTWQVKATATDKRNTVTKTATVSTGTVLMDFLAGGTGIGAGKASEYGNLFDCAFAAKFSDGANVLYKRATFYNTASGDCNTITDEWHLGGNGSANYPVVSGGSWWYVNTIFYPDKSRIKQIAYGYLNGDVYTRYYFPSAWSAWVKLATTESGDWTPALTTTNADGTPVYSARSGRYIKTEKGVWVNGNITLTSWTGGTGYFVISGLPFTQANNTMRVPLPAVWNGMSGAGNVWYLQYGTIKVSTNGFVGMAVANSSTTTYLNFTLNYECT